MSPVVYPLAPPVWQKRVIVGITLLALIAIGLSSLIYSLKSMFALLVVLGARVEWRRFAHYPFELLVSHQGVACRLPQPLTPSLTASSSNHAPTQWQTPRLGLYFLAVPSNRGWWLLTRENLSREAMQAIRRQCFHGTNP